MKDQVCIVTGGGSGIGRATALRMAQEDALVILVGRTLSKVTSVRDEILESGGLAEAYGINVADRNAVFAMAENVLHQHSRIDILINNAGHSSYNRRLLSTTPDEIQSVLDSNLIGSIYCAQAVVSSMLETGSGTIINVASLAGVTPGLLGGMIYSATKAAVIAFTRYLNVELKETNIRSTVVIPGEISTPVLDKRPVPPGAEARATMVGPEDVAEAITMIAGLPQKSAVPEIIIRPTLQRDTSKEEAGYP